MILHRKRANSITQTQILIKLRYFERQEKYLQRLHINLTQEGEIHREKTSLCEADASTLYRQLCHSLQSVSGTFSFLSERKYAYKMTKLYVCVSTLKRRINQTIFTKSGTEVTLSEFTPTSVSISQSTWPNIPADFSL